MKLRLRRELFGSVTFTELSVTWRQNRKVSLYFERPQKSRDLAFHWMLGR